LTQQYHNASNLEARINLHVRFSTNKYGWHLWVFDQLNLPAHARVLELGCGPGRLWLENLERIPEGWDVTLSDFSPGMLDEAKRSLSDTTHPFRFEIIDAQSISFESERFDAVIANHMLYHVPDRAKVLGEIRRVLKRGGRLYATTNGSSHLREIVQLVREVNPAATSLSGPSASEFRLDNGLEELSRWFSEVSLRHYEDALAVTEAEPIVAFILSTAWRTGLSDEQVAALRQRVEQKLTGSGVFQVTKESGIFVAARG
jgi:SAM-dependent methyltransferase